MWLIGTVTSSNGLCEVLVLSTKRVDESAASRRQSEPFAFAPGHPIGRCGARCRGGWTYRYEQLLAKLVDVPTPAGPTPRQLTAGRLVQLEEMRYEKRPSTELRRSTRQ